MWCSQEAALKALQAQLEDYAQIGKKKKVDEKYKSIKFFGASAGLLASS